MENTIEQHDIALDVTVETTSTFVFDLQLFAGSASGIMQTNTFVQSQTKVVTRIFDKSNPEAPEFWSLWFNDWEGEKARSYFQILPIFGFGAPQLKTEGALTPLDQGGEGTAVMFPYSTFGLKYGITYEGRMEDPQNINGKFPRLLRFAADQGVELNVWNTLNQAFNASVPIWDGQALCSSAHTLAGPQGGTYSNYLGAVALTVETKTQADILLSTLPDDRGLATYRTGKYLVVPTGLWQVAEEITGSKFYPNSDENRINVQFGKCEPMVVRYLQPNIGAGPFPWFVSAGKGELGSDAHPCFVSMKVRHSQEVWYDNDARTLYHSTLDRYVFGAGDGRGIVGSQGA